MENYEEDDLELRSTVYTFPPSVQNVIEQVRFTVKFAVKFSISLLFETLYRYNLQFLT